jgi:hypothetical protein
MQNKSFSHLQTVAKVWAWSYNYKSKIHTALCLLSASLQKSPGTTPIITFNFRAAQILLR